MHEIDLSPNAASLSQSMRDIGYSLETALADLIDNSISAGSKTISIHTENLDTADACVAVIDDGCGMSEGEALEAMRPGSQNPRLERKPDDLGRFGLGLKTASFSQCRKLTVVTRKEDVLFAARWDLDLISETDRWTLQILDAGEISELPLAHLVGEHGTCVLWQSLDRILEGDMQTSTRQSIYDKFETVEKHVSLIYHRYLTGEYNRHRINILIDGNPVEPFDPFCVSNKATQLLPEEIVRVSGEEVRIQPFILPHHSKLSRKEYDYYQSRNDFVSNQGVYVYRNGRLVAWGDWFRLVPKTEATKLARVRIDFPNSLDEYWTIDIKKSRAYPPPPVRKALRNIIERIAEQSRQVHVGRGNRLFSQDERPIWVRYSDRGGVRYAVNREHPILAAFVQKLDSELHNAFLGMVSSIENTVPVEAIYSDYCNSPQSFEETPEFSEAVLLTSLQNISDLFRHDGILDKANFLKAVQSIKPFRFHRQATQLIIEGMR